MLQISFKLKFSQLTKWLCPLCAGQYLTEGCKRLKAELLKKGDSIFQYIMVCKMRGFFFLLPFVRHTAF